MVFQQKNFDILGFKFNQYSLEGMTRFPHIYEPFLRLDKSAEKPFRFKCMGDRVQVPDVSYTLTEKVDGTNMQVLGWQDESRKNHMLIRSREELIAYSNDYLWDNKDEVITTLNPNIPTMARHMSINYSDSLWMICTELYGPKIGQRGKLYTDKKKARVFGARIFNREVLALFQENQRDKYGSLRRVNQHVPYLAWSDVQEIAKGCNLDTVPMFGTMDGNELQTPEDAINLLKKYKISTIAQEEGGTANPEGLVLWSQEDYQHPKEGNVMAVFKVKHDDFPNNKKF